MPRLQGRDGRTPESRFSSPQVTGGGDTQNYFQVTAAGSINTKGSYKQIYSSTPHDFDGLWIFLLALDDSSARAHLTDVAIGAAAAEQVVVPNIPTGIGKTGAGFGRLHDLAFWLPVHIPGGSRIALRTQSTVASSVVYAALLGTKAGRLPSGGRCEMVGVSTGTSLGTRVDPGGTVNTKGAYAQLTAATAFDYEQAYLFMIGDEANSAPTDLGWVHDLAIGAGGAEQIIVPNIPAFESSAGGRYYPTVLELPLAIPKGSRIAIRSACSSNDATDRLFRAALLGVG